MSNATQAQGNQTATALLVVTTVVVFVLVLWALLQPAFMILPGPTPEVITRWEIRSMEVAFTAMQWDFKLRSPPPSQLKLSEAGNYGPSPLDLESQRFLAQAWPRLNWTAGVDWNGNGKIDAPENGGDVILQGDQCLVFDLGGIQSKGNLIGFSTNVHDPASNTVQRRGPFYEFNRPRLVSVHGNAFPSYQDPHGMPYAYFSSGRRVNGYNPYSTSDCMKLGVWPYAVSLAPPRYVNPSTFQIVSAGKDKRFGSGTVLPGGVVFHPKTIDPAGRDDMSNFHSSLLGTGE